MMRVRCRVSRMIGDTHYGAGHEYTLPDAQAEKYAARGDFDILGPMPEPEPEPAAKMREAPENKMGGAPRVKRGDVGDTPG